MQCSRGQCSKTWFLHGDSNFNTNTNGGRNSSLFFVHVCSFSAAILRTGGIVPCEASLKIKGKTLTQITDIVATVTSSDFPELQKHSILLFERFDDSVGTKYQPRTIHHQQ